MQQRFSRLVVVAVVALLASCGGDDAGSTEPTTTTTSSGTSAPPAISTSTVTTTATATTTTTTSTTMAVTTTTTTSSTAPATTSVVPFEHPAVWPAADVVFDTPEAAAADFVEQVLGVPPLLGDFQRGDARSGEIVVFSPTDDDDPATVFPRGLVLLRRLAPTDGWFVMAATSEGVSITAPQAAATVAAGPLVVEGSGRGFESSLVVRALRAGDAGAEFDLQFTMTDWATPTPYTVTLDLSGAAPGDVVTLVARGDTGLGTDPSEFAAIPVVISG